MGAVIGNILFIGATLAKRKPVYSRVITKSFLGGMLFANGMATVLMVTKPEKNNKRAFGLQRNYNQLYIDNWTYIGLIAGGAAGVMLPAATPFVGAIVGCNIGFFASLGVLKHGGNLAADFDIFSGKIPDDFDEEEPAEANASNKQN